MIAVASVTTGNFAKIPVLVVWDFILILKVH